MPADHFLLLLRYCKKIIQDEAEEIVIVPHWPAQLQYSSFKRLRIKKPVILNPEMYLLTFPLVKDYFGCCDFIRTSYLQKNFSETGLNVILELISPSTKKQYKIY